MPNSLGIQIIFIVKNVYVVFQQSDPQRRWSQNLCFEARLSSVWLGPWAGLVSGRPMEQQPKCTIISDLAAAVPQLKSHIHTCMFTCSKIVFGRKLCAHCELFWERCKVLPLTPLSIRWVYDIVNLGSEQPRSHNDPFNLFCRTNIVQRMYERRGIESRQKWKQHVSMQLLFCCVHAVNIWN